MKNKNFHNKSDTDTKNDKRGENNRLSDYEYAICDAMNGYFGKRGFWQKLLCRIELCKKPIILIAGVKDSGKTAFVSKSGLTYDFVYQSTRQINGLEAPKWFFSEKAVYIDTDGQMNRSQEQAQEFADSDHTANFCALSDLCRALKKRKSVIKRRAVDGLIFVIDVTEFIDKDKTSAIRIAAAMREQANAVVSTTGYEIPIYFVFGKCDKIDGFSELFSNESATERAPIVGTIIGDNERNRGWRAAEIFSHHYKKIYDCVSNLCLLKMICAPDIEKNRPLCGLSSQFLLLEDKISAFLTEFFKYRGRFTPRFRGFFFISNKIGGNNSAPFSRQILGLIIPNAKFGIGKSGVGTFGYLVKKICVQALFITVCVAFILGIAGSGLRDSLHFRYLGAELSAILESEPTLENQFMALETLRRSYDMLRVNFKHPGRIIFSPHKARESIKRAYIAASAQIIVEPAAKYLETFLTRQNAKRLNDISAEDRKLLYQSLKTYLLLTGGQQLKVTDIASVAETVEQALKGVVKQPLKAQNEKTVRDNVNAVIKFAAVGLYNSRSNPKIIQAVREKLVSAPEAGGVYRAVMDKLHARRGFVNIAQIAGESGLLRYGHNISVLYTRNEWEQTVLTELISASKDPYKADWVMGDVKAQVNETKLLNELTRLYSADMSNRWLDFIKNISLNLSFDAPSLSKNLERISLQESELKRALLTVCSLSTQEQSALLPQTAPKNAAALKDQITNTSNKLISGGHYITSDILDPFIENKKIFDALYNFLKNGAFNDYQQTIGVISEKIKNCDARNAFTQEFATPNSPIKASQNILNNAYTSMPYTISTSIGRVLEAPLNFTASVIAQKVSNELEESYAIEVVAYFNEKLSKRYPFNDAAVSASFGDFEEFFRPHSGILWKYYEKNLQGLTEKTRAGIVKKSTLSLPIPISISDATLNCLNRAEKITDCFFRNDGTQRKQDITVSHLISSAGSAQLWIGERPLNLPVTISMPHGSNNDEAVILRLTTLDKAQEELKFKGEWAIMRLFNHGARELNDQKYRITWRLNVRNIYTANITAIVQSNATVLLNDSATLGFTIPKTILQPN